MQEGVVFSSDKIPEFMNPNSVNADSNFESRNKLPQYSQIEIRSITLGLGRGLKWNLRAFLTILLYFKCWFLQQMRTPGVLGNQQKMQLMDLDSSSCEIEKKQGHQGQCFLFQVTKTKLSKKCAFCHSKKQ